MKKTTLIGWGLALLLSAPAQAQREEKNLVNALMPPVGVDAWVFNKPQLEGKWVLIELLEPWCPHCQITSDDMDRMYQKNKSWLEVVGVSNDLTHPSVLNNYPDYFRPSYPVAHRDPKSPRIGLSVGVPYAVVVDHCGFVRWQGGLNGVDRNTGEEVMRISQAMLDKMRKDFGAQRCDGKKNTTLFPMRR